MSIFWEMHQHRRIHEVSGDASRAKNKADRVEAELRTLRRQLDRVTLACQGMWELIRENSEITEQMLADRIQEVDLRDGTADGKLGHQVVDCPSCGRKTSTRRGFCVMCGESVSGDHIVEG